MHSFNVRFEATFSPVALNHNIWTWITENGYVFQRTNDEERLVYLKTRVMMFSSRKEAEQYVAEYNRTAPPTLRIIGCTEIKKGDE